MNEADVDFVITHPQGYELDPNSCVEQGGVRSEESF